MYKFEYKLSSSFFCNLRELDAKNKGTFKGLMDAFGDLDIIPSTFQEVSPTGVSLRPQLQIDSLNVVVEFQSEKIVITKRCQSFPFDAAEFSKNFISTSLDIVSKFLRIYNKKFTRLSLINEYLFDPDSINVMKLIIKFLVIQDVEEFLSNGVFGMVSQNLTILKG